MFTALHTQGWKTGICDDVYNLVRSDKTAEVAVPRGSLVVVDNYSDFDPSMCPVSYWLPCSSYISLLRHIPMIYAVVLTMPDGH